MNAWDKLSMAEKAEMIGVAVRQGYTHLPEIREKYNEFAEGGNLYQSGGGITDIPKNVLIKEAAKELIRNRLYRSVNPLSDYNIALNGRDFINGKTMDYGDVHTDSEGNHTVEFNDGIANVDIADEIWAKYLQIPEDRRRYNQRLEKSMYRPSMNDDKNVEYWRLPLNDIEKENLIEETNSLPLNTNKVDDFVLNQYNLADYTIGRGMDSKGEYRSYYDRWDINPFTKKYQGTEIPLLNKLKDASFGIGKPVEIYDRIYLDDYYGLPHEGATYLPEVYITSKKKNNRDSSLDSSRKKSLGGPIVEAAMAHYYDGETESSQQMNLPWQGDWMTDEEAQKVEDIRHPQGHFLDTITVTVPYISDSQRMRADLLENIARAEEKNSRDAYILQRNMNQAQDDFARNFGLNLYGLMGGSPLVNLGIEGLALTAPEVGEAVGGETGKKIGNYISMIAPILPLGVKSGFEGLKRLTTKEVPTETKSVRPTFKSELDWSPESWFGTRVTKTFDAEDVAALQSHIPEYHAIEETAKANGTWLKMPDGSTWTGDPRSWIQMQSKEGQKLLPKPLYHGHSHAYQYPDGTIVPAFNIHNKEVWTSSNKYMPNLYGKYHYQLAIPDNTPTNIINADGANFRSIKDLDGSIASTDVLKDKYLTDDNVLIIKNVRDAGGKHFPKFGVDLPASLPKESWNDYISRVLMGDDYVIGRNVPIKSLLGNNGNFNLGINDIYKGIVPVILGSKVMEEER